MSPKPKLAILNHYKPSPKASWSHDPLPRFHEPFLGSPSSCVCPCLVLVFGSKESFSIRIGVASKIRTHLGRQKPINRPFRTTIKPPFCKNKCSWMLMKHSKQNHSASRGTKNRSAYHTGGFVLFPYFQSGKFQNAAPPNTREAKDRKHQGCLGIQLTQQVFRFYLESP